MQADTPLLDRSLSRRDRWYPVLVVKSSGEPSVIGRVVELKNFPATMGRGSECDIVLPDALASRQHLRFDMRDGKVVAIDCGSTNGISWNGHNVRQATLSAMDEIIVGTTVMLFVEPSAVQIARICHPVALAMQRTRAAASSRERVEAATHGLEVTLRYLFSIELSEAAMGGVPGEKLASLLESESACGRALSTGAWLALTRRLAQLCAPLPRGLIPEFAGNLLRSEKGATPLSTRLEVAVRHRNAVAHKPPRDSHDYAVEADECSALLHELVSLAENVLSEKLVSGLHLGEHVDEHRRIADYRVHTGPSAIFPQESEPVALDADYGAWCALLRPDGSSACLAPMFACAAGTRGEPEIFAARQIVFGAPGTQVRLEALYGKEERLFSLPKSPLLSELGRLLPDCRGIRG